MYLCQYGWSVCASSHLGQDRVEPRKMRELLVLRNQGNALLSLNGFPKPVFDTQVLTWCFRDGGRSTACVPCQSIWRFLGHSLDFFTGGPFVLP